eukprot:7954162-Lingulodinium_polyedra.AAC.1
MAPPGARPHEGATPVADPRAGVLAGAARPGDPRSAVPRHDVLRLPEAQRGPRPPGGGPGGPMQPVPVVRPQPAPVGAPGGLQGGPRGRVAGPGLAARGSARGSAGDPADR